MGHPSLPEVPANESEQAMSTEHWPSFREWQTTRLPAPYAGICRHRHMTRDVAAMARQIGGELAVAFDCLATAANQTIVALRQWVEANPPNMTTGANKP